MAKLGRNLNHPEGVGVGMRTGEQGWCCGGRCEGQNKPSRQGSPSSNVLEIKGLGGKDKLEFERLNGREFWWLGPV